ncbi:hypothetical protein K402DRAFT_392225 [Aulographum hederae CBS 113979]|uniref:SH3 domain signaling protein n=1 Tax=Aulographum hederae CBS 113979 TaxID=1176131 RepID=A0A6G1H403_9PEZI|nr:hypothetical protein K402DRAFT_392225 [Aulographum hederae CBS 113979]
MQRMQRKFGTLLPRSAGDAQVKVVIDEFEEADKMLESLIDSSKVWRDSWIGILTRQSAVLGELELMYKPIVGQSKDPASFTDAPYHRPVETPRATLQRVTVLRASYIDLRTDMMEEIKKMETGIIAPAEEVRKNLKLVRKTIKKREDRKLDWERYKGRVDSSEKKTKRSDRENAAYVKHQLDEEKALAEYQIADNHLKDTLPTIVATTISLLPHLLNTQIMIQNTLLAHIYTVLHEYSTEHGFPNPPPSMSDINAIWESEFTPLRLEIESEFRMIAQGKAKDMPFKSTERPMQGSTMTGLNIRNGIQNRRANSSHSLASKKSSTSLARIESHDSPPPPMPSPSALSRVSSYNDPPPVDLSSKPKPRIPSSALGRSVAESEGSVGVWPAGPRKPSTASTLSVYSRDESNNGRATSPSYNGNGNSIDYFQPPNSANSQSHRIPGRYPSSSTLSVTSTYPSTSSPLPSPGIASIAAAKKKPPPPPPPKRIGSAHIQFVTALYDFDGQGAGDLSFREGDRIRIVRKTETTDDWWEGEVGGRKGQFPANYCKV